jgi:hypothetical protein
LTNPQRIWVEQAGTRIALARWGDASSGKPPALLVHGTSFVGEVWDEVASELDERGNPFAWLTEIDCPVRVSTSERSWPIYKDMASRAVGMIPALSQWTFDGVGHCVVQEAPALVLQALKVFEAEAG